MKDITSIYSIAKRTGVHPDLVVCSAFGKTPAEALRQAEIARVLWLETARVEGKPIPQPGYRPAIYQTGL